MPRSRRVEPFWLVLYDDDRKIFTVAGPMTDDTPWIDRISNTQAQRRQIGCSNLGARSDEQAIAEAQQFLGHRYRHVRVNEIFV
ncbi:MAG: hypothetical protein ACP5P4_16320 [Steroidobacteraceae bacterium]